MSPVEPEAPHANPQAPLNVLDLTKARSHVAPKRLVAPGPSEAQLAWMLTAAAQAPDHGRVRPWRFILIPSERRSELGQAFAQALRERDPLADAQALQAAHDKAQRAPCLMVAVVREPGPGDAIALTERLLSLGCALQNLMLAAQAQGFGSGLTSGQAMQSPPLRKLLALASNEQAVCFVNVGTVSAHKPPRARPEVAEIFSRL